MYAIGETFSHDLDDDNNVTLESIGDIMLGEKEYIIAETLDGDRHVFLYEEDEEDVKLIDDEDDTQEIIEAWESEYFGGGSSIGDWDGDSYYDREDVRAMEEPTEHESIEVIESEDFVEQEEDVDSFIMGLMERI